jgi:hypothetical protein
MIEIENIYKKFDPSGFAFLDEFDIPYTEIPTLLLIFDYNSYNKNESIDYFVHEYRQIDTEKIRGLKTQLLAFLDFYTNNIFNPAISNFVDLAAKEYLSKYINKFSSEFSIPILPKNDIKDSIFLDLVTGFDFINFYDQLDSNIDYYLVDKSVFSCKCLDFKAKELGLSNVNIINKDVLALEASDFIKSVGLIRAKNIFKYVPLFLVQLTFFKNLLPINGKFVFQERSAENIIFNKDFHYDKIKGLFINDWFCEEKQDDKSNPLALDTLMFTKIK